MGPLFNKLGLTCFPWRLGVLASWRYMPYQTTLNPTPNTEANDR